METTLAARLAHYRTLRSAVETNVLALATSIDGREFRFQAPLQTLDLEIGGYVVLETDAGTRLGQVLVLESAQTDIGEIGWPGDISMSSRVIIRHAQGAGALLEGPPVPFHDAVVRLAEAGEVRCLGTGDGP